MPLQHVMLRQAVRQAQRDRADYLFFRGKPLYEEQDGTLVLMECDGETLHGWQESDVLVTRLHDAISYLHLVGEDAG